MNHDRRRKKQENIVSYHEEWSVEYQEDGKYSVQPTYKNTYS